MMKYQKANAEIVSFDHNEIFMIQSGDVQGAIEAAKSRYGLTYFKCGQVSFSGTTLACYNVQYYKTENIPHDDAYMTWTIPKDYS